MKLRTKILTMILFPIVLMLLGIVVVSNILIKNAMVEIVGNDLHAMAMYSIESLYNIKGTQHFILNEDGNIENEGYREITDEASIEELKLTTDETGIELAYYYGDTLIATTFPDAIDSQIRGHQASPEVMDAVLNKGETYYLKNHELGGEEYFLYYVPVYDTNGDKPSVMVVAAEAGTKIDEDVFNIISSVLIICLIIAVICTVTAVLIVQKTIVSRMRRAVDKLEELSDGDLNFLYSDSDLNQKDEIGEIARAVRDLREKLKVIVKDILDSCAQVHSAADDLSSRSEQSAHNISGINAAVDEIASSANTQAGETQETTTNIVSMGEMLAKNNEEIDNLNENSQHMIRTGQEALDTLEELKAINARTMSAIDVINEQTNTTNSSASKIREAVSLIASIAAETNLLSLNASIEAARAGEMGKGFAVVADEISKLAAQSNDATKEIEEIVNGLVTDSERAVAAVDEVREIIGEQNKKLDQTSDMFNEVKSGIDTSVEAVGAIAESTRAMDATRNIVVESAHNLTSIAEGNAASTQETSASVTELREMVHEIAADSGKLNEIANELHEQIMFFRLE